MKLSSILCGAAAIALISSSALAHNNGGGNGNGNGTPSSATSWGEYTPKNNQGVPQNEVAQHNWNEAYNGNADLSRWAAKYSGQDNVGNATGTDGATFSLKGNVSAHCVFYTGSNSNLNFNFGQIGIYASEDHGPALAFDQVAGAKLEFRTNLAGCNTKNKVSLSRSQAGLKTTPNFGYDADQFTTEIPYSVKAEFKAGGAGQGQTNATLGTKLTLVNNQSGSVSDTFGAWKSPLQLTVDLGTAQKSLVAGDYTGSFTIQIQAL